MARQYSGTTLHPTLCLNTCNLPCTPNIPFPNELTTSTSLPLPNSMQTNFSTAFQPTTHKPMTDNFFEFPTKHQYQNSKYMYNDASFSTLKQKTTDKKTEKLIMT